MNDEWFIRLDQFLKREVLVESGGEAKLRIQGGEVLVNGAVDIRRGRKLRRGDTVTIDGVEHPVKPEEPL